MKTAIGKVLVREVSCFVTPTVVIGVTKNNCVIGLLSTTNSIAKYCARKLPGNCRVVAVNNGKVVFQSRNPVMNASSLTEPSKRALTLVGRAVHCRRKSRAAEKIKIVVSQQWVTLCFPIRNGNTKTSSSSVAAAVHPRLLKTTENGNTANTVDLFKRLENIQEKYPSTSCRLFSYKELATATSNFSDENLIGIGGDSRVYKTHCLIPSPDGREVALAVKKLTRYSEDAVKEFISEIEIIVELPRHKNIISLVGFCFDNNTLLLVYDFLPRGSLEHNLAAKTTTLSWAERYKIAMGIAEALDYLHSASNGGQSIIHRDVKSSNILLSNNSDPLVLHNY